MIWNAVDSRLFDTKVFVISLLGWGYGLFGQLQKVRFTNWKCHIAWRLSSSFWMTKRKQNEWAHPPSTLNQNQNRLNWSMLNSHSWISYCHTTHLLLQALADPNILPPKQQPTTMLELAVALGSSNLVQLLLDAGATVTSEESLVSPLVIAVLHRHRGNV